jgi:predicted CopG family antitoxin
MVTTIQISDNTKHKLEVLKKSTKKTYDDILVSLLKKQEIMMLKQQVADYYSSYANEDLAEVNEFKDEKW